MKPKVYIRADGNTEIGLGHVIRSLALADMLKSDFDCVFVTRFLSPYIEKEARAVCTDIVKLPKSDEHLNSFLNILTGNEMVVLDNYFYSTDYQKAIKAKGCKLVCIDDIHDKHFVADVVINHGGGINAQLYSNAPYTVLYIGPQYALLRPPFLKRKEKKGDSILISMGGADKNNDILNILSLLEDKKVSKTCYVIIGDAYLFKDELDFFCKNTSLDIQILKNLKAEELAEIMCKCKCAICPPSSISYEYLSLTGGELYVRIIADNQQYIYKFYIEKKLAFDVSDLFIEDRERIEESLDCQKKYFDGRSDARVLSIFQNLKREKELVLRSATMGDLDLYFKWVNDPDERENARSTSLIEYENHCMWFENRLADENAFLWVFEYKKIAIGQIRFEIEHNQATLSYFIDKCYRGKGFGLQMVKLGIEKILSFRNDLLIQAIVRQSNLTSSKIFEHLNFRRNIIDNDFFEFIK